MYSVVLLAAMTVNTADAPGFHKRSFGCTGGMYLHSGCYGSCIGCLGWDAYSAGCNGCNGGCHGFHHRNAGGCYGCMGCYGSYTTPYGDMTPAGNPMTAPPATPPAGTAPVTPPAGGTPPGGGTPKAAHLTIEKPADATIFVDDRPVKSDGTTQSFSTPTLDASQAYFYMVRVDMTRDGKPVSETRRVIVHAGQMVTESFREPSIATAKNVAGR